MPRAPLGPRQAPAPPKIPQVSWEPRRWPTPQPHACSAHPGCSTGRTWHAIELMALAPAARLCTSSSSRPAPPHRPPSGPGSQPAPGACPDRAAPAAGSGSSAVSGCWLPRRLALAAGPPPRPRLGPSELAKGGHETSSPQARLSRLRGRPLCLPLCRPSLRHPARQGSSYLLREAADEPPAGAPLLEVGPGHVPQRPGHAGP